MEKQSSFKESGKKGVILKTLDRCRSFSYSSKNKKPIAASPTPSKTRSWPRSQGRNKPRVAPEGYIAVYVGPRKERFLIKTECMNHPIVGELLEEAEMVYGLDRGKAIELPCNVDDFHRVLLDIEDEVDDHRVPVSRRTLVRCTSGYQKLSQYSRLLIIGR